MDRYLRQRRSVGKLRKVGVSEVVLVIRTSRAISIRLPKGLKTRFLS